MPIAEISPDTMEMADMIVPSLTLPYGIYKIKFFSRMWDLDENDPSWTHKLPFERDAFTYIEIIPTPLIAAMIDGPAGLITRGWGQVVSLQPYLYSYDPDEPELGSEGLEFRYFCKEEGEAWIMDPDNVTQLLYDEQDLIDIPGTFLNMSGGCFGDGPGKSLINNNLECFFKKKKKLFRNQF